VRRLDVEPETYALRQIGKAIQILLNLKFAYYFELKRDILFMFMRICEGAEPARVQGPNIVVNSCTKAATLIDRE
jgi:hypothetical protein